MNRVLLRDDEGWLVGRDPVATHSAHTVGEVVPVLQAVEGAVERDGLHAAGFLAYEAAPAFDAALTTRPAGRLPLASFALFRSLAHAPTLDAALRMLPPDDSAGETNPDARIETQWTRSLDDEAYAAAVEEIREAIAAGATYQANFTMRLAGTWTASPRLLFHRLVAAQPTRHAAYLEDNASAICSASPELFFERDGERIVCRPMKGTAPRHPVPALDRLARDRLAASAKDCAENAMITDMIRNDLGRVARYGTVRVAEPFACERYPTVWQMVSTVEAASDASAVEVFRALFPCASITGAPKPKTMSILAGLEDGPRGVYTGAVGRLSPGRRARWNVAIRTAVVDRANGKAGYGVGGGVVWDSTGAGEYAEALLKARILDRLAGPSRPFRLLETMLWTPEGGVYLLRRHLDRMAASADWFDRPFDRERIRTALDEAVRDLPPARHKLRLLLDSEGAPTVEAAALGEPSDGPVRIAVHDEPVDSADPFLYHKTTRRDVYDAARAAHPDADDVLLVNERGEATETTIANLAIEHDGQLLTPPVTCGLLAGTLRDELLARGELVEALLPLDMVRAADRLWLLNSVRGRRSAVLDITKP